MRRLAATLLAAALTLHAPSAAARTVQLDIQAPLDDIIRVTKDGQAPWPPDDAVMTAHFASLRIGPGTLTLLDPDPYVMLGGIAGWAAVSGDRIVLAISHRPPDSVNVGVLVVVLQVPARAFAEIPGLPIDARFAFQNGNAGAHDSDLIYYRPDGSIAAQWKYSVSATLSGVVTAVPLPPALGLSVAGLAVLAGLRRRAPGRRVSPWRGGP